RRKNGGVILFDERAQERPHVGIGTGKIDMATPDPALRRFLAGADQRRRLGIVNHNKIFGKLQTVAVLLVVHQEDVTSMLREVEVATLESVMKRFSYLEEVIASSDYI